MAYSKGFDWDVFVSYATDDDSRYLTDDKSGWVSLFVRHLEATLRAVLGSQEIKIFWAPRDLGANFKLAELLEIARRSALFLAVTSPSYVKRDWTRKELEAFTGMSPNPRSLFAIEYLPLGEGAQYPVALDQHKRERFWVQDTTVSFAAMTMLATHGGYRPRVQDFVSQMMKQLTAINNAESARPVIGQVADVIARDAAQREKGVVYVAQTTDDLEEERSQVQRHLEQLGFLVLPSTDLPGGGDSFRAAAEADIKQADLYVHLLGPRSGRTPPDLPDGYGLAQFKVAVGAKTTRLLWRHPDVNVDLVTDDRQKELLSDEDVMVCGLQQLMKEARDRLETRSGHNAAPKTEHTIVFINSTKEDAEAAKIAHQEFAARHVLVTTALHQGSSKEVADDLEQNMKNCDVMVMIYGNAPLSWVRGQSMRFVKARGGEEARLVAVFAGPPEEKPADLGFTMRGLRRVDFLHGWSAEQVRRFVEENPI